MPSGAAGELQLGVGTGTGTTPVRHYAGRANFKATDGAWKPIDTELTRKADGRLHQSANSLGVDFAPTSSWRSRRHLSIR